MSKNRTKSCVNIDPWKEPIRQALQRMKRSDVHRYCREIYTAFKLFSDASWPERLGRSCGEDKYHALVSGQIELWVEVGWPCDAETVEWTLSLTTPARKLLHWRTELSLVEARQWTLRGFTSVDPAKIRKLIDAGVTPADYKAAKQAGYSFARAVRNPKMVIVAGVLAS